MIVRPATWADVESVLERLSDQHRAEYRKAGWPGEPFMARMAQYMAHADTRVLVFDDQPQAVLAIKPEVPLPTTWLAVTKEFFEKGLPATRAAKRYMQAATTRHGPILSIIGSGHPKAAKWMAVLGFEQLTENVFLYKPPTF